MSVQKSVFIEVEKIGRLAWTATWRQEDDIGLAAYDWFVIERKGLNKVEATTRDRAIKRATKVLQGNINREVRNIKRQIVAKNSHERVEVMLDVGELRDQQRNQYAQNING